MLVENYRPDVKHRLGIDYERLRAINPRLVYASISGFGQDGPYADRPGLDQIAQGMGGLMSITGLPGQGPVRVGIAIADLTAGVFCAMGILLALLEREESGEGQWVQTSLLAAQVAMLDFQAARWLLAKRGAGAGRQQPSHRDSDRRLRDRRRTHQYRGLGPRLFARLCKALGAEQLATDPAYSLGIWRHAVGEAGGLGKVVAQQFRREFRNSHAGHSRRVGFPHPLHARHAALHCAPVAESAVKAADCSLMKATGC